MMEYRKLPRKRFCRILGYKKAAKKMLNLLQFD